MADWGPKGKIKTKDKEVKVATISLVYEKEADPRERRSFYLNNHTRRMQ